MRDKDEVQNRYEDGKLVSKIEYSCGCVVEVTWRDISTGTLKDVDELLWCAEHDPTCDEDGEVWENFEIEERDPWGDE